MTEPDITETESMESSGPVVPEISRDGIGRHAQAIWDNTNALPEAQIASMYGVDPSLSKDEMVRTVVGRYLDSRPDQAEPEPEPAPEESQEQESLEPEPESGSTDAEAAQADE